MVLSILVLPRFDGSMTEMPSAEAIKKSVEKVGYKNIILDSINSTIFLKFKGMKIGFGALGEGYATNKCQQIMLAKGIQSGIVNATGDMSIWGTQPDGNPWNIGITDPFHPSYNYFKTRSRYHFWLLRKICCF